MLPRVLEMSNEDNLNLLRRVNYGHLGCTRDDIPYVVPVHFAYSDPYIYFFTTEGKKTEIISNNPKVCLQVEEVTDPKNWQSVILRGKAERLKSKEEISEAIKIIKAVNPGLMPALSVRWMDHWIRENIEAIYRISPAEITGRVAILPS
jgi:nitroimidazol reductase NimA-like FMN-containing flavoprotein (pyridoxamine 5'-phosphate oxidase superfamily)